MRRAMVPWALVESALAWEASVWASVAAAWEPGASEVWVLQAELR